uniref:Leucine rich adaptor protein 1 n=1 Tax=Sphenodon punctatus TaxID=8508 RepID=A0A8D0L6F1_SPHPU
AEGTLPLPPDLKDLESKVGRKAPEGLLRWLREDPAAHLLRDSPGQGQQPRPGLGDKIKALKLELAYLRAIDVKILQQLLAVNEGIETVRWLLEEKGTLTSRCSSLTSSQYSLVGSQETSRRGSWNSLQDPNEKLDSISIGSYLDTLADEMDEDAQGSASELDWARIDPDRIPLAKAGARAEQEKCRADQDWLANGTRNLGTAEPARAAKPPLGSPQSPLANGFMGRLAPGLECCGEASLTSGAGEDPVKGSPAPKASRNGRADLEKCKLKSKLHLEYDAHWHWVQSQDDVTFL